MNIWDDVNKDEVAFVFPTNSIYPSIIDREELERTIPYSWYVGVNGVIYGRKRNKGKLLRVVLHRFIMKASSIDNEIDHKNLDRRDNRKENLRFCSRTENCRNTVKRKDTSSRYKGVCWEKRRNAWRCTIKTGAKQIHLGQFPSELEAARAYNKKALELFGEFACLNVLPE